MANLQLHSVFSFSLPDKQKSLLRWQTESFRPAAYTKTCPSPPIRPLVLRIKTPTMSVRGMTQGAISNTLFDRDPRSIYVSRKTTDSIRASNAFYSMVTMFGISVDEYFYSSMIIPGGSYFIYFLLYCKFTHSAKNFLRNGVYMMCDFFVGCHTYARFLITV